jgi:hypothetical protein
MDHPAASDRKGPAVRLHHVAFTVADLERARAAGYTAALGQVGRHRARQLAKEFEVA